MCVCVCTCVRLCVCARVPGSGDLGQRSGGRRPPGNVTAFFPVDFRGLVPAVRPSVRPSGVIPRAKQDGVPGRGAGVVDGAWVSPGGGWGGGTHTHTHTPALHPGAQETGSEGVPRPATLAIHGEAVPVDGWASGYGSPRPSSPTPAPPHPVVATTWDMLGGAGGRPARRGPARRRGEDRSRGGRGWRAAWGGEGAGAVAGREPGRGPVSAFSEKHTEETGDGRVCTAGPAASWERGRAEGGVADGAGGSGLRWGAWVRCAARTRRGSLRPSRRTGPAGTG